MSNQKAIILSHPVKHEYGPYRADIIVGPLTLKSPNFETKSHSHIIGKFFLSSQINFPKKFDIRDQLQGNLTHVLNQGQCGSCWTFSSATAASDLFTKIQLKKGATIKSGVRISPMSFFNITNKVVENEQPVLNGCNGGDFGAALRYMEQNQIPLVTER